ncbi:MULTISPECIES: GNAT family N-acetyltransferase [Streptomyces]|uniref:GNAT family N-acetyltransferase n=1 Tax=Streptomyces TaxID=1883 RepID=UPI0015CF743E|nr:GNAT family N-acetyltransferase [Streptomyces sp. wa1071]WST88632.1 GNAT family N-acetyltransferase [Streptomyces anulatus]
MDVEYQRYDRASVKAVTDEMVEVYARVYDKPPYSGDPFFSVASFRERLEAAFDSDGFETVTARRDGQIIGYVHGATLPSDKPWWLSLSDRRPTRLQALADARQVFWLRELMVLPEYQGQGLGRNIHDTVISGRAESAATLTCIIDNQPAHDAYLRWGYLVMGEIKHAPESPTYNAMYLPSSSRPE